METKRILIPVAPPQQSSNAVSPISGPYHQCQPPSSCRVHYCDVFLHRPPQNSERHAPGGPPVRPCFAQRPPLSFSHPSFSLPVRLFRYSSILPQFLSRLTVVTRSLRPAQQLFHLWNSVQQPVHYAALCSFSPFDVTHADEILFPRLWLEPGHFGTMTCRGSPAVRSNKVRLSSLKNFQYVCVSSSRLLWDYSQLPYLTLT